MEKTLESFELCGTCIPHTFKQNFVIPEESQQFRFLRNDKDGIMKTFLIPFQKY